MSDLLTISEVAEILGVGEDTVTRRFAKVKGVIDLGSPETPKRRRYRVLRIPKSVVEKFLLARGGSVDIKTPPRATLALGRLIVPMWGFTLLKLRLLRPSKLCLIVLGRLLRSEQNKGARPRAT